MSIMCDVTVKGISQAQRNNKGNCAVADAIRLHNPNASHVLVDQERVAFSDRVRRQRFVYRTPPNVAKFIAAFDAGLPVRAIKVRLADKDLLDVRDMRVKTAAQIIRDRNSTPVPTPSKRNPRNLRPSVSINA